MGDLDWRFDKPQIIFLFILWTVVLSVLAVAARYLLHVGWALHET